MTLHDKARIIVAVFDLTEDERAHFEQGFEDAMDCMVRSFDETKYSTRNLWAYRTGNALGKSLRAEPKKGA